MAKREKESKKIEKERMKDRDSDTDLNMAQEVHLRKMEEAEK